MKNRLEEFLKHLGVAARRDEPAPSEPPPHLATRVLATVRSRANDRFWWEAMARHTAVTACILAAVSWFARPASPPAIEEAADLATSFILSELNR